MDEEREGAPLAGRSVPDAVVVVNGPLGRAVSGGDVHAARLAVAWDRRFGGGVVLAAPPQTFGALRGLRPRARRPMATPFDKVAGRGLPGYLAVVGARMLRTARLDPPAGVAVASSHLLHDVLPCVWMRRRGANVVTYVYHLIGRERAGRSWHDRLAVLLEGLSIRLLARHARVVFVDRPDLIEALVARGVAPDALVLTANACDPIGLLPPRRLPGRPLVVVCGRLARSKGLWDALEVAVELNRSHPRVEVVFAGDGPERAPLERRVAKLGLRSVRVLGFVEEELKWKLLREATVFLAPSLEEGWGIAVGEAVLAGTPVVTYDLPAYDHFGPALIRVPRGETRRLAQAVARLLSEPGHHTDASLATAATTLPAWEAILDQEIDVIRGRCT